MNTGNKGGRRICGTDKELIRSRINLKTYRIMELKMKTAEQAASECGNAMCEKYGMTIDYAIPCEDAFLMGVEFGRKTITEQEQHKSKGNEYIRTDLAIEFAARFHQIMVSARVDEYVGARKDVCVNDLFEAFLKSKEDERP